MPEDSSKSLDILGIKPVADSINIVTTSAVGGVEAFLGRICLPALEEYGLLLRDKVRAYRANNMAAIAVKAEKKLEAVPRGGEGLHGHPRLVGLILEQGSWVEVSEVQEMWAGLLASSCSEDGSDDSNLMFVDLLSRLSVSQARLLDHICRCATKVVTPNGLIVVQVQMYMELADLRVVTGVTDLHRIDREMDHLRSLELIIPEGGFGVYSTATTADVTPTPLALQMFARANGFRGDPTQFFKLDPPTDQTAPGAEGGGEELGGNPPANGCI